MDQIILSDLELFCRVGVPEQERGRPQRLLVSVEMDHDFSRATADDNLSGTIDYFAVSQRLLGLGEGRQWRLIETLADEIARLVLDEFGAAAVRVEVKKFIIPEARYVAVRVQRTRNRHRGEDNSRDSASGGGRD